jgi:hypothetical protein
VAPASSLLEQGTRRAATARFVKETQVKNHPVKRQRQMRRPRLTRAKSDGSWTSLVSRSVTSAVVLAKRIGYRQGMFDGGVSDQAWMSVVVAGDISFFFLFGKHRN